MRDTDLDELYPMFDHTALPRVLNRETARRLGFTAGMIEHRLDTGRWRRVLPRTYLTAGTLTWPDRLRAAAAFGGPDTLISGPAALVDDLRSVPRPDTVLVLAPTRSGLRSTRWVQVRHTDRMPPRRLAPGPPRAPVARAVADHALTLARLDDVRALVTEAVRRELCTTQELTLELCAGPRRGSSHLRRAIAEADGGAWSAPEAEAATLLRRGGVPPFRQNVRVRLPGGRHLIVDFLWDDLRAVLEIDSRQHHSLPDDRDATDDRHLALETLGYSVVHRTPWVVTHRPEDFVAGIVAWLGARRALLTPAMIKRSTAL
jgi:very-short-patch-repair endonuclease